MVVRKLYLIKKSLVNNTGFVSEVSTSDLMTDSLTNKLIDSNYNISDLYKGSSFWYSESYLSLIIVRTYSGEPIKKRQMRDV